MTDERDVSAREELIRRAAARGHRNEAEAYFAERDERTSVKALGIGITNADGLTFWMGSYNQTARPMPAYDAVSASDEELDRLAEERPTERGESSRERR